jgi:NAD(P)-dependent dehydrogenase (short-subunit alcohol dehydrogenase family)
MNRFPQFDLTGQTALVTGAARGLGRAILPVSDAERARVREAMVLAGELEPVGATA